MRTIPKSSEAPSAPPKSGADSPLPPPVAIAPAVTTTPPARPARKPRVPAPPKALVKAAAKPIAVKPAPAKARPAAKPLAKAFAQPAKPAKAAKPVKAAVPAAPARPEKPTKLKKDKRVKDKFSLTKAEFAMLGDLKKRGARLTTPAGKNALLRAGIHALVAMNDSAFAALLGKLPAVKSAPAAGKKA